jgi:hypothetical protein
MRSRFRVDPRDVPAESAAHRLGLGLAAFNELLPRLRVRGFPQPDEDTGLFDLVAIDRWCDTRNKHLFGGSAEMQARDASQVAKDRIAKLGRSTTT